MYPGKTMKNLVELVEETIPYDVYVVAKLRTQWSDIVGDRIAAKSQPSKYSKGYLIILASTPEWQTELTIFKDDILKNIPKQFKVKDVRIYLAKNEIFEAPKKTEPMITVMEISEKEKLRIKQLLDERNLDAEIRDAMYHFLCLCRSKATNIQLGEHDG